VRKYSFVFTYLRASIRTRQKPAALAASFMGGMAAEEYRLLSCFLAGSGVLKEDTVMQCHSD